MKPCIGFLTKCVQHNIRNLAVIFDQDLSFDNHVSLLTWTCYAQFRNIANVRSVVSKAELEMIINALISSRLDYATGLYTFANKSFLIYLHTIQNTAVQLLNRQQVLDRFVAVSLNRRSHISSILSSLHWLPVEFQVRFKALLVTFRAQLSSFCWCSTWVGGSLSGWLCWVVAPWAVARARHRGAVKLKF